MLPMDSKQLLKFSISLKQWLRLRKLLKEKEKYTKRKAEIHKVIDYGA